MNNMKLICLASALAAPLLAKVVHGQKGYNSDIICPPCPSGHCCITGVRCAPIPGLGQPCTDSTEAPFPAIQYEQPSQQTRKKACAPT
ncbi:hypothetical protein LMH87_011625 [Akanthomyces muscarius]|uniref:Uncharacterized protein n=1 Tax=Akanthomyces muscarius TaxID=2231603 RepID=A0A9W8Q9J5_AKAMU|nr:hypothetical protein LMH87_011625 [Akanthomyces muscarius]KAJ4150897.1 hypothetical protein LMH87_011625 [Akanthomyces muscarius]